jgi:hypothetical protein
MATCSYSGDDPSDRDGTMIGDFDSEYVREFERRCEALVGGAIDEVFRGAVRPSGILLALRREAEAASAATADAAVVVPNRYLVQLSEHDYARFAPYLPGLADELARAHSELIGRRGWTTRGDVSVAFDRRDSLPPEHFSVLAGIGSALAWLTPGTRPEAGRLVAERYRLTERIASGGLGDVWQCVDESTGDPVAVKIFHPVLLDQLGFAERFRANARASTAVDHPGLVIARDYGIDAGGAYLVMELVDGAPLSRNLARVGRLSPARTMALVAQAGDALHALHAAGLVHGATRPGNLLIRADGTLAMTGPVIVRSATRPDFMEGVGAAMYTAPEVVRGELVTHSADIYGLGVVAYQCLAGRRPFEADHPLEVALQQVRDVPPPLPSDVPVSVCSIVERALAKEPADRWQTAADLAAAARQWVASNGR